MNKSNHTFSRALVAISALLLVGGTAALAVSQAGTAADPLITKSYTEGTFRASVLAKAALVAGEKLSAAEAAVTGQLSAAQASYADAAVHNALAVQVAAAMGANPKQTSAFSAGAVLTAPLGTELLVTSGAMSLSSGALINLTTGAQVKANGSLVHNHIYLAAEGGAVLRVAAAARAQTRGPYTLSASTPGGYVPRYTAYAAALEELGLFSGSNIGYELERPSTRAEGLVMLLRLLGKEQQARNYAGGHPFRDVPAWAEKYVAYAYQSGYTSGMSETEYGAQRNLTANDYMTFLLRALGYNDSKGDFAWRTATDTAVRSGILTQAHQKEIAARGIFYRDDIAYASFQTLKLARKGVADHLSDYLIDQGVFTRAAFEKASRNIN